MFARVAEVAREHRWHPTKSLDSDENFKPQHTLFCRKLRFVAIYELFGDLWAKKVPFGSKTVFFGQKVHYYKVYQRPKKSELSGRQNSMRKNFPDEVRESFSDK